MFTENIYLGKFDSEGRAMAFLLEGVNYTNSEEKTKLLAAGYVQLNQEEWEYYTNNRGYGENGTGYIRDPETGKPVSAPPYVPTAEEIAEAEREAAHAEITMETVEEALCAMDESIEEIKDALCEIDAKLEGGN